MTRRISQIIKSSVCLTGLFIVFPLLISAQESNRVVGTWNAIAETDDGDQSYVWTIKKSGESFSGQIVNSQNESKYDLQDITFDGTTLVFEFTLESEGSEFLIKVKSKLADNKLDGTWSLHGADKEIAAGKVAAEKKINPEFAGKWSAAATLPNGNELESTLTLKGKNAELSGVLEGRNGINEIDKITSKGNTVRFEFNVEVQGNRRGLVVEAELESANVLTGKWIVLDDSGDEAASGDWKATRESGSDSETVILFDGSSMDNFRGYAEEAIGDGWKIEGDSIALTAKKSGDIITKKEFGNFELEFEWKISEGGNSGVMYRVSLGDKKPYRTGPEYQLLDDSNHKDGKNESTSSGALYALYAPKDKSLKPVGQWNTTKIVLKGNHVEHWLNGAKVVDAEIGSSDWNQKLEASKFATWPKFAKNKKGHIAFQDHGNPVWFRNIKIKPLD